MAMAEHSIYMLGHHILLNNTSILAKKSRCMDKIRKKTMTELHPNNMNREKVFSHTRSWKPLICNLKEQNKVLSKNIYLFLIYLKMLSAAQTIQHRKIRSLVNNKLEQM
jgi:hypothetical protein